MMPESSAMDGEIRCHKRLIKQACMVFNPWTLDSVGPALLAGAEALTE
jgi:hypothetical protein